MNIDEKVIEFVRANPLSNTTQIAKGVGFSSGLMRRIVADLYKMDRLDRHVSSTYGYQYMVKSAAGLIANAEYNRCRKLAEELEVKGLFRRAAQQWLEAMDSTSSEGLLEKAAARRADCVRRSEKPRQAYTGASIADASASTLSPLALWRK